MKKIILSDDQLRQISKNLHKKNKKIVLTHGVFDLVHIGHIKYFKEAKQLGEVLVVSVTSDRFVNKGYNKPYFDEQKRLEYLSNIELIDYVYLSDSSSSIKSIKLLKPNFYVKGKDYKKKSGDVAGNLNSEINALKKVGGKFEISKSELYSSTELLNFSFDDFNPAKKIINKSLKNSNNAKKLLIDDYSKILNQIKKDKVLILGEIIIDKYISTLPLGKPSKEDILSVNLVNDNSFLGGTVPIVKMLSELSNNITFLSIYKKKEIKKKIKSQLKKNINLKLFNSNEYVDIVKTRYLNDNNAKIFETYQHNSKFKFNNDIKKFLKKNIKKYSHVIISDFGHGLIDEEIIEILVNKSKHLSINVQTNSGNRGFNLFSKYKKADFLCLDLGELRLGLADRISEPDKLFENKILKNYKNIILTLGVNGHIARLKNRKNFKFPALNTKAILDTMGAGDAFYTFASCFVKYSKDPFLISIIAGIAGAIKTQIIGHSNYVKISDVEKSFKSIIK